MEAEQLTPTQRDKETDLMRYRTQMFPTVRTGTVPAGLSGRDMLWQIHDSGEELYDAEVGPKPARPWRQIIDPEPTPPGPALGTDWQEWVVRCCTCNERIIGQAGDGPMWAHDDRRIDLEHPAYPEPPRLSNP